ncbi:MAG: PD40 domain-containing protein [Deltaproteobacteria bacterium]|nr:PD40 domain-containing protein [Deltaproteobacteria bacterium]
MDHPGGGRGEASPLHFESARAAAETRQEHTADYTIAFSSLAPWDLDVFIANADGSNPKPLAAHPDLDYNAAFSPDGQWIVFTSHRAGGADLYRIHPDGSGLQRLTDHPAFDDAAAFSPDGKRLAFVSSRSGQADIWMLELESGKTWNVTNSPGGDFRPTWSPDGQWIAFSSDRGTQDESDIYVIRPDGTGLRRLTDAPGWDGSPTWSPDGGRVAYYSTQTGSEQIFTVGIDNNNSPPTRITNSSGAKLSPHWGAEGRVCFSWAGSEGALGCVNPDHEREGTSRFSTRGEFLSPKWSPDGKRVMFHRHTNRPTLSVRERFSPVPGFRLLRIDGAFPSFSPTGDILSFTDNFRSIERMKIDGSDRHEIYKDSRSPAFAPAWSPMGDLIAFTRGRVFAGGGTDNEIYVVHPDGSGARNVTQYPVNDALPSWSPDGQRLVFRSTRDGNKELYVIGADGTGLTRLTTSPGTDTFPHWSPLGDRIVFASDRTGDFEIYTVRPDSSDVRQLTHSPGFDMHPVWSPDGKWICFASARGGLKDEHPLTGNPQPYGDLYLMRPDGSEVRALTDDQFEDGTPGWAPLPHRTAPKVLGKDDDREPNT